MRRMGRGWLVLVAGLVLVVPAVALAVASFDDVPEGHTHFDGIEWMKTAAVTQGCDADSYCPDDPVTRAQMGTFMYRLAKFWGGEDGQVDAADHADDADTLQGSLPGATVERIEFATSSTNFAELDSMSVTVPGPGTIVFMLSGNVVIDADAAGSSSLSARGYLTLSTTSGEAGPVGQMIWAQDPDNADYANATPAVGMTLVHQAPTAGTYTVYLNGNSPDGDKVYSSYTWMTAIFLPGDGTAVVSGG